MGLTLIVLGYATWLASAFSQEIEGPRAVVTNLDVLRSLARAISVRTISDAGINDTSQAHVTVFPREFAWCIESGIVEGVKASQLLLTKDSTAALGLEFGFRDAGIRYSNVRREGFFGKRVVDRIVNLRLTTKVVNRQAGGQSLLSDYEESLRDTIGFADISTVENPTLSLTKGILPTEGFLSHLAEPIVIIGSIAVAVLLLFNVRS